MALTSPLGAAPPVPGAAPGAAPQLNLAGLANMMGAAQKDRAMDQLLVKMRPALKLISQLEQMVEADPEILPVISSVLNARILKSGGGRGRQQPSPMAPTNIPPTPSAQIGSPGMGPMPGLPPMGAGPGI